MYRSGDLTRGRPDGVVDYLGRVDHHGKSAASASNWGEMKCACESRTASANRGRGPDGLTGKQLVAYVVPADPALINAVFREALRRAPVPPAGLHGAFAHFMFFAQMPLTSTASSTAGLARAGPEPLQHYVAPGNRAGATDR